MKEKDNTTTEPITTTMHKATMARGHNDNYDTTICTHYPLRHSSGRPFLRLNISNDAMATSAHRRWTPTSISGAGRQTRRTSSHH